ncbi:MAG: protein PsiE [Gammaproteobacteria bacterium]
MLNLEKVEKFDEKLKKNADTIGNLLVHWFHALTLFFIGAGIVWSGVDAFIELAVKGHHSIEDILLLFIYLELLAMVGIYFKTNHMPVRYLIYVAITALTRMLISNITINHVPDAGVLYITGAILILSLTVLILRYGSAKYPYGEPGEEPTQK